MGKVVFWAVLMAWLFIGLAMMIWCYRRNDTGSQMDKTPVAMAIVCLLFGPIILLVAVVEGIIEAIKRGKNVTKNGPKQ